MLTQFPSELWKSLFRGLEISQSSGGGCHRNPPAGGPEGGPYHRAPSAKNLDLP